MRYFLRLETHCILPSLRVLFTGKLANYPCQVVTNSCTVLPWTKFHGMSENGELPMRTTLVGGDLSRGFGTT